MKIGYLFAIVLSLVVSYAFAQDDTSSAYVRIQNDVVTVPAGATQGQLHGGIKIGTAEFVGILKQNDVTDYKQVVLRNGRFGFFSVQRLNPAGKWLTVAGNYSLAAGHRYTLKIIGRIDGTTGEWIELSEPALIRDE